MAKVNDVANMFGCDLNKAPGAPGACAVNASLDGTVARPASEPQLCDRIIADDAVLKLRLAAAHRAATGTPFFLAVGFRKPHLPFRFPAPFLERFPAEGAIPVAAHPTLPPNVPALAHHDGAPQVTPFAAVANATAQRWRRFYYAAVSWMDTQLGRVLGELDALGLAEETLVVMHSDHGWSLGEHGNWQKFTNSEQGARVPLLIRAPWIAASRGARSAVLAELVDVYPTMVELMGLPAPGPAGGPLDGTSLAPVLRAPADAAVAAATKSRALSQYMRCPHNATGDPSSWWKDNACLMTDRTQFGFMGLSLRTAAYRYTEWYRWNATALAPAWGSSGLVGRELYSHDGDDGSDFDLFENANEADDKPSVVASLSAELRVAFHEQQQAHQAQQQQL